MNNFTIFIVFLLGSAAVLQAGLNRHILEHWGILPTVLLNSLVFISVSVTLYWIASLFPTLFPSPFKLSSAFTQFKWWYLLPGLFGFFLVMILPIAISQIGATKTFIYLVIAQMLSSLLWDMYQESTPLTLVRVMAVLLAVASIALINWEK